VAWERTERTPASSTTPSKVKVIAASSAASPSKVTTASTHHSGKVSSTADFSIAVSLPKEAVVSEVFSSATAVDSVSFVRSIVEPSKITASATKVSSSPAKVTRTTEISASPAKVTGSTEVAASADKVCGSHHHPTSPSPSTAAAPHVPTAAAPTAASLGAVELDVRQWRTVLAMLRVQGPLRERRRAPPPAEQRTVVRSSPAGAATPRGPGRPAIGWWLLLLMGYTRRGNWLRWIRRRGRSVRVHIILASGPVGKCTPFFSCSSFVNTIHGVRFLLFGRKAVASATGRLLEGRWRTDAATGIFRGLAVRRGSIGWKGRLSRPLRADEASPVFLLRKRGAAHVLRLPALRCWFGLARSQALAPEHRFAILR